MALTTAQNTFSDYAFVLEKHEVELDQDDEYKYEEVPLEQDAFAHEADEDFESVLRAVREAEEEERIAAGVKDETLRAKSIIRPEPTDDFVRNFLARMKLFKTLDCFQNEWYERIEKGLLDRSEVTPVPDVYVENSRLTREVDRLREDMENCKKAALVGRDLCTKMRKERDFHRLEHRRLVNEKNKLINDIKRLKTHYAEYEPMLERFKQRYEAAMKEKILTKIDRDRAIGELVGLKNTFKQMESNPRTGAESIGKSPLLPGTLASKQDTIIGLKPIHECQAGNLIPINERLMGPTQQALARQREKADTTDLNDVKLQKKLAPSTSKRMPNDSEWPPDSRVNPYLAQIRDIKTNLRGGGMRLAGTLQLHSCPISAIAAHRSKNYAATASDDFTWKLFTFPAGEVLMIGEGHKQWLSSLDFHPEGQKLASGSGDNSVRIWDFDKSLCEQAFAEHQAPVWSVSYHWTGNFVISGSEDQTIKIWDIGSLRCRQTLYGHKNSVNSVEFLAHSNTILSASADRTVSLWDGRTGLCAHTLFGHLHAINSATFNEQGTLIASADAYGDVKIWDVRKQAVINTFNIGSHAGNDLTFDPTGTIVAVAANDGAIKVFEMQSNRLSSLSGHQDAVQSVVFDCKGQCLLSGGSDGTVRIWS